jgi:N-acetylneuraminic acid mutarotase
LFVIGGFDHQDTETTSPSTLNTCEKYNDSTGKWSEVSNLIHPVAFAAITTISDEFLYVFGGFEDYSTVDVIQKYSFIADRWDLLSVKLPVRLAKMGAATVEEDTIIIVGGIYEDANNDAPLSLISNCYKLSLTKMAWSKASKMKNKRTLNSCLYYHDSQIYAIGSANEGACEKYDPEANRWINIPSYNHILENNDLQSFSVCMYESKPHK